MPSKSPSRVVIHWFRQDLRLTDNRALSAAAADRAAVIPVYVLDDEPAGRWAVGGASRWWLEGSLATLRESLAGLGSRLILRRGPTTDVLLALAAETGATAIHCTRAYEPQAARLEHQIKAACDRKGISFHRHSGNLLCEPETIETQSGAPFRVFTPFWRTLQSQLQPFPPVPAPTSLAPVETWPDSDDLVDWRLRPTKPDWASGLRSTWTPGEAGALQRCRDLIDDALPAYSQDRDRPDRAGTSMLSPHLHFGEISPNQIWDSISRAAADHPAAARGAGSFLREVGWREFSYHLLHHWPDLPEQPFRPEFANFPWQTDKVTAERHFQAWTRGDTGYPVVDAGMRQLWEIGWMHNRVRMITASFLTKHLLLPWQTGAQWFWDTLVDADLASNSASWQWVAGSGADAAPYFRIFNPILQGLKFDPEGDYVRQFVPELAKLPTEYIHAPWTASPAVLAAAGVELGATYPRPIVDHAAARQIALSAYATIKSGAGINTSTS